MWTTNCKCKDLLKRFRTNLGIAICMLVLAISAQTAFSGQPSSLPGFVGRTIDLGGKPVYGVAAYDQDSPAVAFDGRNYLVVWNDCRTGSCTASGGPTLGANMPAHPYGGGPDIFGTRVSPSGEVVDRAGISICVAPGTQTSAAVAAARGGCLVVWRDERDDFGGDIYGARISSDGEVLDPGGFPISVGHESASFPIVGSDGTDYLVVWYTIIEETSVTLHAIRVGSDGTLIDREPGDLVIRTSGLDSPAIAFDGVDYLLVWQEYRDHSWCISGMRIGRDGTVLETQPFRISQGAWGQFFPAVAFDGTNYMVVWMGVWGASGWDVCGARVDVNGRVLDPTGIPIAISGAGERMPSISFDGTNYLVAWTGPETGTGYAVGATRVAPDGTVLDPSGIGVPGFTVYQGTPVVASSGENHLLAWWSAGGYHSEIYGARVGTDGNLLDENGIIDISTAASLQVDPAVAFGNEYFAVWADLRMGTDWDVYGSFVDSRGKASAHAVFPVSTRVSGQKYPAIAFDGRNYLVVWQDGSTSSGYWKIHGVRVDAQGQVLDSKDILLPGLNFAQEHPAVAFDGTNYLVVWQDYRDSRYTGWQCGIYGARVSADGQLIDTDAVPICTAAGDQQYPSISFDGAQYLVVWQDGRKSYTGHIFGARVATDGTVLDPNGVPISGTAWDDKRPSVASDGTNWLVVWQVPGWLSHVYGARVDQSGHVLDPAGIVVAENGFWNEERPALAFDGSDYVVAWAESLGATQWDIHGTRVGPDGSVAAAAEFTISAGYLDQEAPVLCSGIGSMVLAAYSSFVPPPRYGSDRIEGNILGESQRRPDMTVDLNGPNLYPNCPDPFVGSTNIRYYLPRDGYASLKVYDVQGRVVKTILDQAVGAGLHEMTWDGQRSDGPAVQGIYFLRLDAGSFSATRKMVLLK